MQRGTPADAACQLCRRVETLGHCLRGCTHTLMSQMYSQRHGHAVHKIATSIQHGIKGACPIFYDAEGHNRSARQLPQWLPLTQGSSIPDIILVTGTTQEQLADALRRHNIEEEEIFEQQQFSLKKNDKHTSLNSRTLWTNAFSPFFQEETFGRCLLTPSAHACQARWQRKPCPNRGTICN